MSLFAVFIASLLGSPHCAGMCGGFVICYSGASRNSFSSHLAYNGGRLVTYLCLGILAGLIGRSINDAGAILGVQKLAQILTAGILIYWGFRGLFFKSALSQQKGSQSRFQGIWKRILSSQASWTKRAFLLGLVSTFLPCGWLYTFVAVAAGTASPLYGALVMLLFWMGTLPVLASLAGISQVLGARFRKHVPRVTSALLLFAGVFSLLVHSELLPSSLNSALHQGHSSHDHHHSHH